MLRYLLSMVLAGCTIDVTVDKPNIEIQCVIVELPGGQVITQCDGGLPDAAGSGEAAASAVQPLTPGNSTITNQSDADTWWPQADHPAPSCPNSDPLCKPLMQ